MTKIQTVALIGLIVFVFFLNYLEIKGWLENIKILKNLTKNGKNEDNDKKENEDECVSDE